MSRFFLDTEFLENDLTRTIELISIAIVDEGGAFFYAVSSEFDEKLLDVCKSGPWVRDNVMPHLGDMREFPKTRAQIMAYIRKFIDDRSRNEEIEIWGYYADYDWVAFCQLFGTMMDLPENFPKHCKDLKQYADDLFVKQLPAQTHVDGPEHSAIADARWNLRVWSYLHNVEKRSYYATRHAQQTRSFRQST